MKKSSIGYIETTVKPSLQQVLASIIQDQPGTIAAIVATDAIDECNPETYIADVSQFGCVSGAVSQLVYTADAQAFYDEHYSEIETLREESEVSLGEPMRVHGDLKTSYAWFAYETTARRIYEDWESY